MDQAVKLSINLQSLTISICLSLYFHTEQDRLSFKAIQPSASTISKIKKKWVQPDLNWRPFGYQPNALTMLSYGPITASKENLLDIRFLHSDPSSMSFRVRRPFSSKASECLVRSVGLLLRCRSLPHLCRKICLRPERGLGRQLHLEYQVFPSV